MKQFNPNWPFPQYNEKGERLLPPPAPKKPVQKKQRRIYTKIDFSKVEEALF